MKRGRSSLLALVGVAASAGCGAAQQCEPGLAIGSVQLHGTTTATPGRVGVVQEMRWPATVWRDSMSVNLTVSNSGPVPIRGFRVMIDARAVVYSLHAGGTGDSAYESARGRRATTMPASLIRLVDDTTGMAPGQARPLRIPIRLTEVFPWFSDSLLQLKALPVAAEFSVFAAARDRPGASCVDDLADNSASFTVPLRVSR